MISGLLESILSLLQSYYYSFVEMSPQIIVSLLLIAFFYLVGETIKKGYVFSLKKYFKDPLATELVGQLIKWTLTLFGIFLAFNVLGFTGLATKFLAGAGITAIIIGFAFRDIAENFLAGILLASSRPFNVGNVIETVGIRGKVRGLTLRYTHIKTADGKDVFIPNASIIKNPLVNFTRDGLIRQDFTIGIPVQEDIAKATTIIRKILDEQKEVIRMPQASILLDEISDNQFMLRVSFWLNIFKTPVSIALIKSELLRKIKNQFIEAGFSLPNLTVEHIWDKSPLNIDVKKKPAES